MRWQRGPGRWITLGLAVLILGVTLGHWLGWNERLLARLFPSVRPAVRLSAGDFPSGVAAPLEDVATVPLRPVRVGFTPRGSSAAILWATSGVLTPEGNEASSREGLLTSAYALDSRAVVFADEASLQAALALGGDHGGVDFAAIGVDRLALWGPRLRDAAPRTVLLLGRSRGQEAMAAVGFESLSELRGKRVAYSPHASASYFGLWLLSRAGLRLGDVRWVELPGVLDAGQALREGKADAALGLLGDVELAARDRSGTVLASTVDAPHLVATVLVVRGEFAARYPDAVRRVVRGLLDASSAVQRDPQPAARLLGQVSPQLGDPTRAMESAPTVDLADNLAFFGISGVAPVTYDELYRSANELYFKLGRVPELTAAQDTRDLAPLKFVARNRRP